MKKLLTGFMLIAAVSACGEVDTSRYQMDCREAGGEITKVGSQVKCMKDGEIIAEWNDYS